MQIILLDENRFDEYALYHPSCNYYQSSNYGKFMSKHGYNAYYLGLVNDSDEIKAATLIIVKNENDNKRKMGYAPRGFLINWDDDYLVSEFTNKIKDFLAKRGFTYLKVDPKIIYKEHNLDGTDKDTSNNEEFIKMMQKNGYIHMGYNNELEASKPRWDNIIELNSNLKELFNSISKEARENIKEAAKLGNKIYIGSSSDITLFHETLNKKTPPIEYYLDFYEFFGKNNNFQIYFSKLEPVSYVNSSKSIYEKEVQNNNNLSNLMQYSSSENKENIINQKLKSDNLLSKYKKNMLDAINLFQKYPTGVITAVCAVITFGKTACFFANGIKEEFKDTYPDYLLYWQIVDQLAKKGYKIIDFNAMPKSFLKNYNDDVKHKMANKIVEYVGEFDLVINKKGYYTGNKLNPILNWLNTPI